MRSLVFIIFLNVIGFVVIFAFVFGFLFFNKNDYSNLFSACELTAIQKCENTDFGIKIKEIGHPCPHILDFNNKILSCDYVLEYKNKKIKQYKKDYKIVSFSFFN